MYLWVVLATFLAMIAGYYLPMRHDTHDIINVPVAQAKLVQMTAQHKLIKKWLYQQAYPYKCYIKQGATWQSPNSCTDEELTDEGKGHVPYKPRDNQRYIDVTIVGNNDEECSPAEGQVCLLPEEIPNNFGFRYDRAYYSRIFCFAEDKTTPSATCDRTPENKVARLLITVGPIPEKWQSSLSDGATTPAADFMNAMRAQFGRSELAGYVTTTSPNRIINYENNADDDQFNIPQSAFINSVAWCLEQEEYHGACLVYMTWL